MSDSTSPGAARDAATQKQVDRFEALCLELVGEFSKKIENKENEK